MISILKKYAFTGGIILCVTLAYFFPNAFIQWGPCKLTTWIVPLIQVIMFGMGTTLSVRDFTRVLSSPLPILVGAFLQFTVMPLVGFVLVLVFGLEGELAAGVILIGSVAGGVASNVMAYLARANVALSVTMTCVSTLLSPILTPLLMRTLAGRFIAIDARSMALSIVSMILLPVVFGLFIHAILAKFFPKGNALIDRVLSWVSMVGICFILAVILAPAKETVRDAGGILIVAAIIHNALGYVFGYWGARGVGSACGVLAHRLGWRAQARTVILEADCRTVAIEVAIQNGGMGTALAIEVMKSPIAALAPSIFGIWMNAAGSLVANWWSRRPLAKN